ncbi:MAG: YggU family protein [Kiritimatiellae bacterium]|nr:YggU family protein [Kiritimatiellia bacterium]
MYLAETSEGVVIGVRAQPRCSRAGIAGLFGEDAVKVRLRSAPVDGKANKELVETLAEAFGIPKSAVSFKGGETSRTKHLLLRGVSSATVREVVAASMGA